MNNKLQIHSLHLNLPTKKLSDEKLPVFQNKNNIEANAATLEQNVHDIEKMNQVKSARITNSDNKSNSELLNSFPFTARENVVNHSHDINNQNDNNVLLPDIFEKQHKICSPTRTEKENINANDETTTNVPLSVENDNIVDNDKNQAKESSENVILSSTRKHSSKQVENNEENDNNLENSVKKMIFDKEKQKHYDSQNNASSHSLENEHSNHHHHHHHHNHHDNVVSSSGNQSSTTKEQKNDYKQALKKQLSFYFINLLLFFFLIILFFID